MDDVELKAAYWLDLVDKRCDELEVQDALERHSVSLDSLDWVGSQATLSLPACGVRLLLWKTTAEPQVIGIEFVVNGMREGKCYEGDLPHGIDAADELMEMSLKLHPSMLMPASTPNRHEALWPAHRVVVEFDADGMLMSCAWVSTRARP
jgi:hypothetical protein